MKSAAILALLSLGVAAENHIKETEDGRLTQAPRVNIEDCKRGCIFENEDDYLCFTTAPPAFRIGWEWEQFYGETSLDDPPQIDYYQLKWKPYFEAQGEIESELELDNLIWIQYIFKLDQFKMDYFISVIINSRKEACFGIGWDSETINIGMTLQYIFVNCLKKVFEKICDLSETWKGNDAKWFDECTKSDTAIVDIWDYEIEKGETDQIRLGTVDPKSAQHCSGAFGINVDSLSPEMNQYIDAVGGSLADYYLNNIAPRLFG